MTPVPVLVIIPTYNEAGMIGEVISRIEHTARSLPNVTLHILQIDDSSTDESAEIASSQNYRYVHQIIRPGKFGLGTAYLFGFRWALAAPENFQFIIQMDGDGSHLPEQLPDFIAAATTIQNPALVPDLIIGTRWMSGGEVSHWPLYRRFISQAGTKYAQLALKLPLRDLTSGYRLFSRRAIQGLSEHDLASKGYSFQIETAMKIVDSGAQVQEIPIHFEERTIGRSKMSGSIALEAWRRITIWGIQRRIVYRR